MIPRENDPMVNQPIVVTITVTPQGENYHFAYESDADIVSTAALLEDALRLIFDKMTEGEYEQYAGAVCTCDDDDH